MSEIIISENSFLFHRVGEPILDGKRQPRCFEAHVSPRSFAEPTTGRLLIGTEPKLIYGPKGLAAGEVEHHGYRCKWLTGLVLFELDSGINCLVCGAKDSIKYNAGIEKVWCGNCGVDVSKL